VRRPVRGIAVVAIALTGIMVVSASNTSAANGDKVANGDKIDGSALKIGLAYDIGGRGDASFNDLAASLPKVFDLKVNGIGYATSGGRIDAKLQGVLEGFKARIIEGGIKVADQPQSRFTATRPGAPAPSTPRGRKAARLRVSAGCVG
jgi:basic membrane lipoprotein Med (substrate-binding protein (PBP1-ABC) superfamily)